MTSKNSRSLISNSYHRSIKRIFRRRHEHHDQRDLIGETLSGMVDALDMRIEDYVETEEIIAEREKCENSLHYTLTQLWHVIEPGTEFLDGYHIGCVSEHLEAFYYGQIPRLIINIPPRHCKSILCGVALFCWAWAKNPESRWLYSSHDLELSMRDSTKCRDVIQSKWYQSLWGNKFSLKADQNTKKRLMNDRQGHRFSSYVGGGVTGDGGDYIVTDDPNSAMGAKSAADRQRAVDFWTGTMVTRVNDPNKIRRLIVQQRLNRGDLTGFCIAADVGYETLILPIHGDRKRIFLPGRDGDNTTPKRDAIKPTTLQASNPSLMDNRNDGDILWPERFTNKSVDEWTKELKADAAGQLEMRPAIASGAIFKDEKIRFAVLEMKATGLHIRLKCPGHLDHPDKLVRLADCEWFQTIDTAIEAGHKNDCTAIGTFGLTPFGDLIVFDMFMERLEVPDQLPVILALRRGRVIWNRETSTMMGNPDDQAWPFEISWQGIEPKASGNGIVQAAKRVGIHLRKLKVEGGKVARSSPLLTLYEAGAVYHLEGGSWRYEFEGQLTDFPNGDHDDGVDSATYAGIYAARRFGGGAESKTTNKDFVYNETEPGQAEPPEAPQVVSGYWDHLMSENVKSASSPGSEEPKRSGDHVPLDVKPKSMTLDSILEDLFPVSDLPKPGKESGEKKSWVDTIRNHQYEPQTLDDLMKEIEKTAGEEW
jgi:predicted phage terminase large subunit-like protein